MNCQGKLIFGNLFKIRDLFLIDIGNGGGGVIFIDKIKFVCFLILKWVYIL